MIRNKISFAELLAYLGVTFIAICAFKILLAIHSPNQEALISTALGVLEGRPHWLAYQNRLLGPYTVQLISMLGVSFKGAWMIYHATTLLVLCLLIYWMLRQEKCSQKESLGYLVGFLFAFLTFQDDQFYTWDCIDLIVFTAFAYGIFRAHSRWFFVGLFLVGILNRESALFIAVYLMLDSVEFSKGRAAPKLKSIKSLAVGSVLLILGMAYTKFVRHALFVSRPSGAPDTHHELIGNHIYFLENLNDLFWTNFFDRNFVVSAFLLTAFAYFASRYKAMSDRQLKCFAMLAVLCLNILIFGIINETRMLFILFPFFLFLWLSLHMQFGVANQRAS